MPAAPTPQAYQVVERYGAGTFQISGQSYATSVLVFPEETLEWPVKSFADVDDAALAPVVEGAARAGGAGRRCWARWRR